MIKVLDKHIADKIAAGEVIDRPVSIIKELVENSIDAGAGVITVEIKNGGKTYIRVTDNGCGIQPEDVETAFKRHATSKITSEQDLDSIGTLGFRGEALASISAVSRTELITRTKEARVGRKVVIEGSQVIENTGMGCPEGTTITVRDLFYNVPARRKFLGSDNAEARRITELMSRLALSYSDIKISLINGGRTVFSTGGSGNIFNNIVSVYGADISKDLIPVDSSRGDFILKGFISSPAATVPSRNREIFCVNGRVISSKVMQEALEKGYSEKLFGGRFPVAFLFLALPAWKVDVNIHPTKKEIRFDDDFEVSDFVREAVNKALSTLASIPEIRSDNKASDFALPSKNQAKIAEKRDFFSEFKGNNSSEAESDKTSPKIFRRENEGIQVNINNVLETMRHQQETIKEMEQEVAENIEKSVLQPKLNAPFDFDSLEVVGSIFNTYILAEDGESFFMIDQHAAHERVFYEKFMHQYETADKLSQQLLIPLNVSASGSAVACEEDWLPILKNSGYEAEFFGNNTYIIREVPAFMTIEEAESFVKDLLNEVSAGPDLKNKKVVDRLITKSCKSAVKGGDTLHPDEVSSLIAQLKKCYNPFSCPHGRPTFIRMKKYEIEKMFKRV